MILADSGGIGIEQPGITSTMLLCKLLPQFSEIFQLFVSATQAFNLLRKALNLNLPLRLCASVSQS